MWLLLRLRLQVNTEYRKQLREKNQYSPPRPRQIAHTTVLFPDPLLPQIKLIFWHNLTENLLILNMSCFKSAESNQDTNKYADPMKLSMSTCSMYVCRFLSSSSSSSISASISSCSWNKVKISSVFFVQISLKESPYRFPPMIIHPHHLRWLYH